MDAPLPKGLGLVDEAVRSTVARLLDENGALKAELADIKARLADLEQLADRDTLTPLPNRRAFLRELERVVARVGRYGSTAALMYVDVDRLKGLNDRHGHPAGDAALTHVASVLRTTLRAGDLVARIGGDEFAILVEAVDQAAAETKARALVAAVEAATLEWEGAAVPVSVSIGVAMVAADDDIDALIARADAGMYAAKAGQRSAR